MPLNVCNGEGRMFSFADQGISRLQGPASRAEGAGAAEGFHSGTLPDRPGVVLTCCSYSA